MNLRRYQEAPAERRVEGMTRDEACEHYKGRILLLARRLAEQAGPNGSLTAEDLVAYGVLGLLEAFDRFSTERSTDFESFASYRIRGQMCDALLGEGSSTRREREISRDLARVNGALRTELGREPTHEEVARRLGVSAEMCWRMREIAVPVKLVPLPERPEELQRSLPTELPVAPMAMLAVDARRALKDALERLSERERQVVLLYYARDCSLAEIGAILEVTPSRVSQILTEARTRLRKVIGAVEMDLFAVEGAA
jgi:RNA polymerase sigma factor for flagellar operon FliA